MVLWKMIGIFIVIIQLVTSLPVDQDKCKVKRKLCGQEFNALVENLCEKKEYVDCPKEDDNSKPEAAHTWQVKDQCCKIGCKVGYVKFYYCLDFLTSTGKYSNHNNRLKHFDLSFPPVGIDMISGTADFTSVWPFSIYFSREQPPIYQ